MFSLAYIKRGETINKTHFVAVIMFFMFAFLANATEYYVSTSGNDGNPGTLSQPWKTIGKATSTMYAGDTVYIRGGTYNERIVPVRSGTSGNKITYRNYQDEVAVIRGEANVQTIVTISGKNHIVIDGLTIKHQNTAGWKDRYFLVTIGGGSSYNEIRNSRIIRDGDPLQLYANNMKERGIQVSSGSHNLIEDNYIRGVNIGVLLARGSSYSTVRNNTITETGQSPVDLSGGGLGHNLIENNYLEWSAIEDGIQFEWDYDIDNTHITDQSTVIRNNIIRNNAENALDFKGAGSVLVEGNIIYGTIGSNDGPVNGWNYQLVTITRGANAATRDIIIRNNLLFDNSAGMNIYDGYRVYHNTVVGNNRDYEGPDSSYATGRKPSFWGIRQMQGKVAVKNNIVIGHNVVEVALRPSVGSSDINNNMYYNTRGVYFTDYRTIYEWEKMTFSEWKTYLQGKSSVSGNEANSIIADPKFVNAPERPVGKHGQFDFRLQSNSPAIDAGGPLTRANGAGSGRTIRVDDARYFFDGYNIADGDFVQVGSNNPVEVTNIDYSTNTLTLASSISWNDNDWVSLPYEGSAPDIGAYEFGGTVTPPPSPSECTEADWSYSDGECQSDNTLVRRWTKTGDCTEGVNHPNTENTNCVYSPPSIPSSTLSWEAEDGVITAPFSVSDGYIYHTTQATDPLAGGKASYTFNIDTPGEYIIKTIVNAETTSRDSFFVNIDDEPTSPDMIWDIMPLTNGFEERTVSWRGSGTFDNNEFVPKRFTLSAGNHELIIRGRESNTKLDSLRLELYSTQYSPADVNQDGKVNMEDILLIVLDFGKTSGFGDRTDVKQDGRINLQDLVMVAKNLGKS